MTRKSDDITNSGAVALDESDLDAAQGGFGVGELRQKVFPKVEIATTLKLGDIKGESIGVDPFMNKLK